MIADPKQWRLDAARCLLLAAESATNLETREELIALAHIWLKRAAKLEVDLLKQQKGKYLDERGQKAALSRAERPCAVPERLALEATELREWLDFRIPVEEAERD